LITNGTDGNLLISQDDSEEDVDDAVVADVDNSAPAAEMDS
jgi:hypothetical protein